MTAGRRIRIGRNSSCKPEFPVGSLVRMSVSARHEEAPGRIYRVVGLCAVEEDAVEVMPLVGGEVFNMAKGVIHIATAGDLEGYRFHLLAALAILEESLVFGVDGSGLLDTKSLAAAIENGCRPYPSDSTSRSSAVLGSSDLGDEEEGDIADGEGDDDDDDDDGGPFARDDAEEERDVPESTYLRRMWDGPYSRRQD